MGNATVAAKRGKRSPGLCARNLVRAVAEQRPASRQSCKQLRPVLETRATDDADRNMLRSEALQCLHQLMLPEALRELAAKSYVALRRRHSVLIAEEVSDQRQISAAPRRHANARPETAAISTAPLPIDFAGKDECIMDVDLHGLGGEIMRPNSPDSVLYLMFPTANGPIRGLRASSVRRRSPSPQGLRFRMAAPRLASAATRRPLAASSCVWVRTRTPARPQQATTSAAATMAAFLSSSLPSAACTCRPEPRLDFTGARAHAPDAVITYERDIGAFERSDHRNRKSRARRSRRTQRILLLKVAPLLVAERFLDAGQHRGRGRE